MWDYRQHLLSDHLDELDDAVGEERRLSCAQFKEDAPKSPEVRCVVIRLLLNQFGGHVEWRAFNGGEKRCVSTHHSSKTIVKEGIA